VSFEVSAVPYVDFAAGDEGVRVECMDALQLGRVRALWAPALSLPCPAIATHLLIDDQQRLWVDGACVSRPCDHPCPLAELQQELVVRRLGQRPEVLVMHAALLVYQGRAVLLVGHSGAGKSTMTRQFVQAGASYVTDDCVIVKAQTAYGMARSIHFDPLLTTDQVPPYLAGCDLTSFHIPWPHGVEVVPLWPHYGEVLPSVSAASLPWTVVALRRGEVDHVASLGATDRLCHLHGAVVTTGVEYQGEFGFDATYELTWHDPAQAFDLLTRNWDAIS